MMEPVKINVVRDGTVQYLHETEAIKKSKLAADFFRKVYDQDDMRWVESFYILMLNQRSQILGYKKVSQGGITGTVVDPKVIFSIALNTVGCTNLICCHNHPSGNIVPSDNDNKITTKLKDAGTLLELNLLDHIILGSGDQYYSYADDGII